MTSKTTPAEKPVEKTTNPETKLSVETTLKVEDNTSVETPEPAPVEVSTKELGNGSVVETYL